MREDSKMVGMMAARGGSHFNTGSNLRWEPGTSHSHKAIL